METNEKKEEFKLTDENYHSPEARKHYLGASMFKEFLKCEVMGLAKVNGEFEDNKSDALLFGSYVDAYFSGELDEFIAKNPDLFTKQGTLKSQFKAAEEVIKAIEEDEVLMKYLSGNHQTIMTGTIEGVPFKIKMDSYHEGQLIVDLKVMASMLPFYSDGEWKTFIDAWGYDIQAYIYQQVVKYNTGKELPFYFAVLTKEDPTDLEVIHLPQWKINAADRKSTRLNSSHQI